MKNWRQSKEYRKWRIQVIRRDKRCVICDSNKKRTAHHINDASYHPDLRFDIDNGVCLCYKCHMNFHTNYKRSYREKCTIYDWNNFRSLLNYLSDLDHINKTEE